MRLLLLFLLSITTLATQAQQWNEVKLQSKPGSVGSGDNSTGDKHIVTTSRRADGYIVYKGDTVKGLILLAENEVFLERIVDRDHSKFYSIKMKDRDLKTIMMYNVDKKWLCLTRVKETDKKLMRLLHEGKLTVYDDWSNFIYKPSDIDPFMIVVSYNGEIDNLGSFTSQGTRKDLIGYINDVYGLTLPKNTKWDALLRTMDELD